MISRRQIRIDLQTPAERSIRDAMEAVEHAGADIRLTKAVMLLSEALEQVGLYTDDKLNEVLNHEGEG